MSGLAGDLQSYLPHRGGRIVCGCFDPMRNLRAPREIDVGTGPWVLRYAQQLADQREKIPVFLKRGKNDWIYKGIFRALRFSQDERDVRGPDRRPRTVGVLFLEELSLEIESEGSPALFDAQASEGHRELREHWRRERSRYLAEIKKRLECDAHDGALICEVCGLSSHILPAKVGEFCFEVHHLLPLGKLTSTIVTKIDDLALLCANCHRMAHSQVEPLLLGDLVRLLRVAADIR